ncbi:iron-containing alcohol dehydrogenase [uncultured Enorma sp.]|uniref:iron-containing alcohol dehydrogenase n=1 Tax=uncultured Enorma sp. TaxID=1714346 RepID=UPI0028045F21|nr:iron-containing alcohol dehydrogenase [uncultured Enorma sp.]
MGEEHEALAAAGIDALEAFIAEIGLPTKLSEMGIEGEGTDEMLRAVADSTIIIPSCPKVLDADEVYEILEACK